MSTTPPPERLFPTKCPCCQVWRSIATVDHCENGHCGWLKCRCGAHINEAGDHSQAKVHGDRCPTKVGI